MSPAHDALSQLVSVTPRAVISCNSWAYQFVQTFDDLAAHLGPCLTIPAFDATALAALMRQATQLAKDQSQFLSADSGDNIFETNEDGIPTDPFFKHLAHRSLGHPWVAVAMFEAATQQHTETETDASRSTTWVRPPEAPELPAQFERHMRFALQALLLHGPREEEALMRSLPTEVPPAIWSLLETAGFVCRTPDHVRIQMTAYPTIRAELGTAGFNLDRL